MTRETSHALYAREVGAIDGSNHLHHPARGSLLGNRIDHEISLVGAGAGMTVRAVIAQTGRHDSHCREEIIDAEFLERAGGHVLEDLSRLFSWCGRLRSSPIHQSKTT